MKRSLALLLGLVLPVVPFAFADSKKLIPIWAR